jgi:Tfp pilus assembly protein PilO
MEISGRSKVAMFLAKYFKWVIIGSIAFVLVGGYWFFIKIKYESVLSNIVLAQSDKEKEFTTRTKYFNNLIKLNNDVNGVNSKYSQGINKLNIILPSKTNIEDLMPQMEIIALRNGLMLLSVQLSQEDNSGIDPAIGRVKISADIVGTDYNGFKTLLSAFEKNLRLMDINTLNFDPKGKKTTLEIYTYYLK